MGQGYFQVKFYEIFTIALDKNTFLASHNYDPRVKVMFQIDKRSLRVHRAGRCMK